MKSSDRGYGRPQRRPMPRLKDGQGTLDWIGDVVKVVVLSVDEKRHRISLSMKQAGKIKAV